MSTAITPSTDTVPAARTISLGITGGLVGGAIFGVMMATQGMLPMVASLVGSQEAHVGLAVHLVISAAAGLVLGAAVAAVPALARSPLAAAGTGLVYGMAWWVGGALIAMPLLLGMGQMVLVVEQTQLMSLMGHAIFGIAAALTVHLLSRRA